MHTYRRSPRSKLSNEIVLRFGTNQYGGASYIDMKTKVAAMETPNNSRLIELLLFSFAIKGCLAACLLGHYLIPSTASNYASQWPLMTPILAIGLFVSFLFGHALGASTKLGQGDTRRYLMSICLRTISAMLGMIIAILSNDTVWCTAASLIAAISLIGTHFVHENGIRK